MMPKQRRRLQSSMTDKDPKKKPRSGLRPYVGQPTPGRNKPCPCGSGKKYKVCCLASQKAKEAAARQQAQERRERLRRGRTAPRPLGVAVTDEFVPVTEPQFSQDATITAMRNAGVKPEVIHAFQKTGRFIAPESRQMYDEQTLAEWDAAIKEYEADGEEDCVPDEEVPPGCEVPDPRE